MSLQADGMRLIFSSQTVTADMRIDKEPTASDSLERVRELLRPQGLMLAIIPVGYAVVPDPTSSQRSLRVLVRVKRTHEALSGATITLSDPPREITVNDRGEALIAGLTPRRYVLSASARGYETVTQSVRVRRRGVSETKLDIAPQSQSLNEIVVETSRFALTNDPVSSATALSGTEMSSVAGTDEDISRALQHLPGNSSSGISAKLHVRGARDDEALFRFDGVDLIDPFHLKDFQSVFSALDPAVADGVTFWSGDFPVDYGSSIGGVLDIRPRRITAATAEVGVSMIDNSVLLGTPFADGRGSVFVNARASNLKRVMKYLDHDIGEPEFGDLTARATWDATPATSFVVGALILDDDLKLSTETPEQEARANYRDRYVWIKGHHDWSDRIASETTISNAKLHATRNASVDRPGVNSGTLSEAKRSTLTALRQEVSIDAARALSFRLGAEISHADTHDTFASSAEFLAPFVPVVQKVDSASVELSVPAEFHTRNFYAAGRWQPWPSSVMELGLRRDGQNFEAQGERSQWNLRASLLQHFGSTTFRIGWGQYSQAQAINDLDVGDGYNDLYRSRRMRQVTASVETALALGWQLRVAGYVKHEEFPFLAQENIFSFLTLAPEIEIDRKAIASQGGRMRGVEVSLSSDPQRALHGSISFSHARAFDRIAAANVPRSWDQPNALQAQLNWQWHRWNASAQFDWHTGWPYTPLLLGDGDMRIEAVGGRNTARERSYRSIDLRAAWTQPLRVGSIEASLELRNAFNFENVCCREYRIEDGVIRNKQRDFLPLTPIAGIRWRW